jgi:hypothetical protein
VSDDPNSTILGIHPNNGYHDVQDGSSDVKYSTTHSKKETETGKVTLTRVYRLRFFPDAFRGFKPVPQSAQELLVY